ncbi:DnaJ domain-containing protein [Xylaria sp. FL1042]|nr:DnaJ domain-containing protein [Xylaria sp. FL1042]
MAPAIVTDDYYAVLGVVVTADTQAIRTAYRRLARVTHPDKNPNPNGKEEFQRLQAAYETLSDPKRRSDYDATRPKPFTSTRPPAGNAFRAQENPWQAYNATQTRVRAQALERLQAQWAKQDMDIFEARRNVRKLQTEIDRLQEEDAADTREAANRSSWWGNVSSLLFGVSAQAQEAKEERERRRLDRSAAIRIKSMEVWNTNNKLHALETAAETTATAIEELKQQIWIEERRQEAERAAQAQRKMQEETFRRAREADAERQREREQAEQDRKERERKRREQEERDRDERERRNREQREREQEAQQEREEQMWRGFCRWQEERMRKERERTERERTERELRERQRKAAESRKGAREEQHRGSKSADKPPNTCLHKGRWTRIPGRTVCSICSETLARFALQCPGCRMKACASCKRNIQDSKR